MKVCYNTLVAKRDLLLAEGIVDESLPNTMFRVTIENGPEDLIGKQVLATLAGKMRLYRIQVLPGDRVKLEISSYDKSRGRITYRQK